MVERLRLLLPCKGPDGSGGGAQRRRREDPCAGFLTDALHTIAAVLACWQGNGGIELI